MEGDGVELAVELLRVCRHELAGGLRCRSPAGIGCRIEALGASEASLDEGGRSATRAAAECS
jgi:hypothetical protein